MKILNPLEVSTIRKGRLIAKPLFEKGIHPKNWQWHYPNTRYYQTLAYLENDLYNRFRVDYHSIADLDDKKLPKKVKGESTNSQFNEEKKSSLHYGRRGYFELNKLYRMVFVDELTGLEFMAGIFSELDYIQPEMECYGYFDFNPYAVLGTGFSSWGCPYFIDIFDGNYQIETPTDSDWQMKDAIEQIKLKLEQLKQYTKIDFNENNNK